MENHSSQSERHDYLDLLLRHKFKIVLLPLLTLALGLAVIFFAPRAYQSEAKVLMRVGRESVGIDPTATTGQTLSLMQSNRDSEIQSAIDLLSSRGIAEKVVDQVGIEYILDGGPPGLGEPSPILQAIMTPLGKALALVKSIDKVSDRELAIIEFSRRLSVDSERDSTVIVASYETKSPQGAQHILSTLLEVFQSDYMSSFRNPQSRSFFEEQSALLKQQLSDAENLLRDAKNRMGLASISGRRNTYESQLSSIELAMYNAEQEFASTTAKVQDLTEQLTSLPERLVASKTSLPNSGADLLRDQLYELEMRQIDLKARYNEDHPLVRAVSAQVAEAKEIVNQQQELREETVDDINPIHRQLSLDLKQQETVAAGLKARLKTLEEQKQLVLSDLKQLNVNEVELEELKRQARLASDKYFKYANNLEQARIDEALQEQRVSSLSLPQPATLQEKPVSPSKLLVGLATLMLAFGVTVGSVVASETLNGKMRTAADVEQSLGVPVLAEVPESSAHGKVLSR